ncbi:MAG TPA: carboxypeptidase-like regulatory domain-containing protein, partial [Candidatus Cryptobacteroides intestinipullorum]|nr:carboxypeptidase-like regulatory domain-containing protein [Candidatus Cryptobacteroides intestinipullorum]
MLKHTLLATLRRIVLPVVMALVPLTVFAQQIDMSLDKVTVRRAMEYLQREYGYSISVRSDEVDIDRIVTVKVTNASLNEVLDRIFTGQDVEYAISGKSVSVRARETVPQQEAQVRVIRGKILDEDSEPLAGASVVEKGTVNGTVADENGNYSIRVTTASPVLVFSFFGFADEEITAGKSDEIDVRMTAQSLSLDDVVVVGYGSMTRRDITSAIGSFTPKAAERREVLSV